jgi:hypothetical protein
MESLSKNVYIYNELLLDKEIKDIFDKYNNTYDIRFNKKSYRKCDKKVIMDNELATLIWKRLEVYVDKMTVSEAHKTWIPFCCSNRIKLIRYKPGDSFGWHIDASSIVQGEHTQSKVTFSVTIYLNTVPKKHKGATEFRANAKISSIQPVKGQALLINTMYGPEHCGQELKNGEKYILRLDVLSKMVFDK